MKEIVAAREGSPAARAVEARIDLTNEPGSLERICVNVADAAQAAQVVRGLARRRLLAAVVAGDGGWQVEVASTGADARSVLAEIGVLVAALSTGDVRHARPYRDAAA